MTIPARIEYEGAFYHVINRGNGREDIFIDDNDRYKFYAILRNIEDRYGINIYVFVLENREALPQANIMNLYWKG